MNAELLTLISREASHADRVLALNDLMTDAREGFLLPDEDVVSLGQFVWSCGSLDTWLAVGGTIILGNYAVSGSDKAAAWLQTLSTQAGWQVRVTAAGYLRDLGVLLD